MTKGPLEEEEIYKSIYYAKQPTRAIRHYPIDSCEDRELVFPIHKFPFVHVANYRFSPALGSFRH